MTVDPEHRYSNEAEKALWWFQIDKKTFKFHDLYEKMSAL